MIDISLKISNYRKKTGLGFYNIIDVKVNIYCPARTHGRTGHNRKRYLIVEKGSNGDNIRVYFMY